MRRPGAWSALEEHTATVETIRRQGKTMFDESSWLERIKRPLGRGFSLLVLYFSVSSALQAQPRSGVAGSEFVGSQACESCHQSIYDRWENTLMANVLQDAKAKPEVILGDFSTANPLVTFKKEDIVFTYGSKWKQRYFTKIGDDYFVFGAQWDVRNKLWRRYYVREGTDWWVSHYPKDRWNGPRDRCAMAVIRPITTTQPGPSRSGTSAVRNAMALEAAMSGRQRKQT